MSSHRYLQVKFGDNDFGISVQAALRRIWADVHENNAHLIDPVWGRKDDDELDSLPEMFQKLHKIGALEPMIARAIDCENHYSEVEFATRGLHSTKFSWKDKIVTKTFKSITDTYLSVGLSFHPKMSEEWANGEEAWLDLETGKVESR